MHIKDPLNETLKRIEFKIADAEWPKRECPLEKVGFKTEKAEIEGDAVDHS